MIKIYQVETKNCNTANPSNLILSATAPLIMVRATQSQAQFSSQCAKVNLMKDEDLLKSNAQKYHPPI